MFKEFFIYRVDTSCEDRQETQQHSLYPVNLIQNLHRSPFSTFTFSVMSITYFASLINNLLTYTSVLYCSKMQYKVQQQLHETI